MVRTINAGHIRSKRRNIIRNLVTELLLHGHISVTASRKLWVQKTFDNLITLAKKGDLHSQRQALQVLRKTRRLNDKDDYPLQKLQKLAEKYKNRSGGYLKVFHLQPRSGDNAPLFRLQVI